MPLLSPNINAALQVAGISENSKDGSPDIKRQLERAGLSTEEILVQIQQEMTGAESSSNRLRAAELGLKVHGLMKDAQSILPIINFIIKDSQPGINPILVPREITLD